MMSDRILAHRKAIQQALTQAMFHAQQLQALIDANEVPPEDRLPFDIQCLLTEVEEPLPPTVEIVRMSAGPMPGREKSVSIARIAIT